MPTKKPAASVIAINHAATGAAPQPDPPQPPVGARKRGQNCYTRRAFMARFLCGTGVWKAAREQGLLPTEAEQMLREQIMGDYDYLRRAA